MSQDTKITTSTVKSAGLIELLKNLQRFAAPMTSQVDDFTKQYYNTFTSDKYRQFKELLDKTNIADIRRNKNDWDYGMKLPKDKPLSFYANNMQSLAHDYPKGHIKLEDQAKDLFDSMKQRFRSHSKIGINRELSGLKEQYIKPAVTPTATGLGAYLGTRAGQEKQAKLKAIQTLLASLANKARIGGRMASKFAPAVGSGVGGYSVGHHRGYGSGYDTGHDAGYGAGSAEGGKNAIRNLYKGLYDLMQQGAASDTDLGEKLSIGVPAAVKAGFAGDTHLAKQANVLRVIREEMSCYDVTQLTKLASTGQAHTLRLKYAALATQYLAEKQALTRLLAKQLQQTV